jgi:K+-transporting ATPase KdpF subunit
MREGMIVWNIIVLIVGLLLILYLFVSVIRPERF